jgi:ADP-heptose:LPS heptosyltransferase
MKVLIVKVSALGDVVHALPVLAYLKSADQDKTTFIESTPGPGASLE